VISEAKLREIEERAEKATSGPWMYGCGTSTVLCETGIVRTEDREAILVNCGRGSGSESQEDGEFIAASRTDVPALTKALRELAEIIVTAEPYLGAAPQVREWLREWRGESEKQGEA
jgi:hypothetical protein